jgi:hypothetical protein
VFAALAARRREWRALVPPVAAAVLLAAAARLQGDGNMPLFARLAPSEEYLQRLRAAYVWVSLWPAARILHELVLAALAAGAWARVRGKASFEASVFLLGLAAIGLVSMPASWLLLEQMKWSLMPQVQPMRALLFVALAAQMLAVVAALKARTRIEALAWFAAAFLVPVQAVWTEAWEPRRTAVALGLAALCVVVRGTRGWQAESRAPLSALRLAPVLAAFFLLPTIGGVRNYPKLHTAELEELCGWARAATPKDALFLFAGAGRGLEPGIFRAEALRAVYVDWKSGGQVNYLRDFGGPWWFRWQQTLARGFEPADLARYAGLGIEYVVLQKDPGHLPAPLFANARYLVYRVQ